MKITCNNCEELLGKYLCDIPFEWRTQLVKVICKYLNISSELDCNDVKKCETLTALSAFTVTKDEVCIEYTDENKVKWRRCFNIQTPHLNLNPNCIMSQEDWDLLTWNEQIQAILDYVCCENRVKYVFHRDGLNTATEGTVVAGYTEDYVDAPTIEAEWPTIGTPGIVQVTITYVDTFEVVYLEETINVDSTSSATFWSDINGWLLLNNFNDIIYDGALDRWTINSSTDTCYIHIKAI